MPPPAFAPCDFLVFTHLPSFYKVNLYNALAERLRIAVVFIGETSSGRTGDFVGAHAAFEHAFLNTGDFEKADRFAGSRRAAGIVRATSYGRLLVNGWDRPEFWAAVFAGQKRRNCLALESTIWDSPSRGAKGAMKRLFLSRIAEVFAAGEAHQNLLAALGWRRTTRITNGVGIINKPARLGRTRESSARRFLYIGRLAPEKNLPALLAAFARRPELALTIVGNGPDGEALRAAAPANVVFRPHVDNTELAAVFDAHDRLVLPSVRETWGLVVEEALYNGLPVLVSSRSGSAELIRDGVNGWRFDPYAEGDLDAALGRAAAGKPAGLDAAGGRAEIDAKDEKQVAAYLPDEVRA